MQPHPTTSAAILAIAQLAVTIAGSSPPQQMPNYWHAWQGHTGRLAEIVGPQADCHELRDPELYDVVYAVCLRAYQDAAAREATL